MPITTGESRVFEFGEFRLDAKRHRLYRRNSGEYIPLANRAVEFLTALVSARGLLLTKDELLDTVWAGSIVEEANLTQTVFVLRKALGDDTKQPRFILTIPGRGYQFICDVTEKHPEDQILDDSFMSDALPLSNEDIQSKYRISKTKGLVLGLAALLLLVVGFYWFFRASTPASLGEIRTIAILPFEDLSEGPTEKYLGVSFADALANRFGSVKQITVRPTRSVLKYAETREDLSKIGRELQVDAVLDGRIQRVGESVRINVQLVRTSDNATIWTEQFDDQFTNFFAVQDSVSQKIVQSLALKLDDKERERFDRHGTENAEAYQDYLRGRYFWNKRTPESFRHAVANFEQAVAKDSNFALAYAGLADCYALMPEYVGMPTGEAYPRARAYAERALLIDDQLAETHTTLGYVNDHSADPVGAEREFKRAIELNPNYPTAHHWYSRFLRDAKRLDEALAEIKRASELDPVSAVIMTNVAQVYKEQGNYDAAVEQLTKALSFDPSFAVTYDELARVYLKKGLYAEALVASEKAVTLSNRRHTLLVTLCEVHIATGNRANAISVIKELEQKHAKAASYYIAYLYAEIDEREQVFAWLERAISERHMDVNEMKKEPRFDPFRNDVRFIDLLRRVS